MSAETNFDTEGGSDGSMDAENTIVLEHISSRQILVSILVLVVLYVLSKWLVSQQEPNVRVDGKYFIIMITLKIKHF